ncbi:uncharacterized protein LOC119681627 isoform X1 [Teleopsis dalmanni]|uniref:uncharacterized protein LOC119681627 isoform X1 n=1 Tax=Teleopsis dalmanni TaxID=139649 RepID=UPI0018CDC21C|nr:uncharacterized protein LOC119681627 isoform X1 [Teleopsis dalmanni]
MAEEKEKANEIQEEVVKNAKDEYSAVFQQMVAKLSAEHFELFAKVFKEKENSILKFPEDWLKQKLLKGIQHTQDKLWSVENVGTNLAYLQILKEKYKEHAHKNWKYENKSPEARTIPTFMFYKEKKIRFMQKQVESQEAKLADLRTKVMSKRAHLKEIEQARVLLKESMIRHTKIFEDIKADLKQVLQDAKLLEYSS